MSTICHFFVLQELEILSSSSSEIVSYIYHFAKEYTSTYSSYLIEFVRSITKFSHP